MDSGSSAASSTTYSWPLRVMWTRSWVRPISAISESQAFASGSGVVPMDQNCSPLTYGLQAMRGGYGRVTTNHVSCGERTDAPTLADRIARRYRPSTDLPGPVDWVPETLTAKLPAFGLGYLAINFIADHASNFIAGHASTPPEASKRAMVGA